MDKEKYTQIIDFAIDREKEAVNFYHSLLSNAKFEHQKEMFKEFEEMERGHIAILENIGTKNIEDVVVPDVPDLKISDYLVEQDITDDMDLQQILITAMKREEKSHDLYNELAEHSSDEDTGKLFSKLAGEEAKHKLYFETLYDDEILKEN